MTRLRNIQLVRQEEPDGCLVACLAMVAGRKYANVRGWFRDVSGGLNHYQLFDYLWAEDFACQHVNQYSWATAKERSLWPLPLIADATICFVDGGRGGAWTHGIVALRDGRVLDPAHGERQFKDYSKVGAMMPVFDVRSPAMTTDHQ